VAASFEDGSGVSDSTKYGELLDELTDRYLMRKDSDGGNWLFPRTVRTATQSGYIKGV
jgi:hypothetical protein